MLTDLGQYAFQGEIGRGAMAIVWRAWDTKLERVVAVKESLIPPGTDPQRAQEMAARFVLEAKAAARLSHPNLVSIYDADVWNGRAAIIMEYVEGQTLSAIIDREPLSVASALGVVDQLLDAVAYAHANGVVHRDIKPDNVFVTAIGRVKLSDFGVARVSGMQRLTQAGTVVGTPGYMAPEQILGASVDERADLFSIGVIVYEMLAGANPFGATDGVAPTEIMRRVVNETPPVLEGQVAGVSPELQGALNQSMRKDPASRFHTAQAMLTAFRYCAGGPPTMAEVPLPNYAPAVRVPPSPVELVPPQGVTPLPPSLPGSGAPWQQAQRDSASRTMLTAIVTVAAVGLAVALFAAGDGVFALALITIGTAVGVTIWLTTRQRPPESVLGSRSPDNSAGDIFMTVAVEDHPRPTRGSCSITGPAGNMVMEFSLPARIGRADDVEIAVFDDQVSRYHAQLCWRDGQLWVEDLGSRNGTLVDGYPIYGPTAVTVGQTLLLGNTTLVLLDVA